MAMCIHSQEFETCGFGCTFRNAKELRLENDKLQKRIEELESKMIITIVRLNERIKEMQAQLDMEGIG